MQNIPYTKFQEVVAVCINFDSIFKSVLIQQFLKENYQQLVKEFSPLSCFLYT